MKRTIVCLILAAAVAGGSLFGQERRWPGFGPGTGGSVGERQNKSGPERKNRGRERAERPAPEKTSISGVLTIAKGRIAVKSGDTTYYLFGLNRYIGFIDGLKEGASAELEGYARVSNRNRDSEKTASFVVTSLKLGGKTYDLDMGQGRNHDQRHFNRPNKNNRPEAPWQNRQNNQYNRGRR